MRPEVGLASRRTVTSSFIAHSSVRQELIGYKAEDAAGDERTDQTTDTTEARPSTAGFALREATTDAVDEAAYDLPDGSREGADQRRRGSQRVHEQFQIHITAGVAECHIDDDDDGAILEHQLEE